MDKLEHSTNYELARSLATDMASNDVDMRRALVLSNLAISDVLLAMGIQSIDDNVEIHNQLSRLSYAIESANWNNRPYP